MDGIRNSSVILCCITRKYTESKNCKREIAFADGLSKPIEILMFEKLEIGNIGSIGFIITPNVRHNLYKIPQIFKHWKGTEFDTILKCLKGHLRPSTGSAANRPSSSKASNDTINTQATMKSKAEVSKAKGNQKASGSPEKGTNCKKNFPKIFPKFSLDGEGLLASGSWDNTIKLWDTKTGECIRTLNGHGKGVESVSYDGMGLLASGSDDTTIKLWNVKTGECIRTLNGHGGWVYCVSFDGEGLL